MFENYDLTFPDQPTADLYLPIWAKLPAFRRKPAFVWCNDGAEAASMTFEDLDASVQSISSRLSLSLRRGDTVLILCPPGLELVEIVFACMRAGLVAVPVTPPSFPDGDHRHLIRAVLQTRPKAAIATNGYIDCVWSYEAENDNRVSRLLRKLVWIGAEGLKGAKIGDGLPAPYRGCRAKEVYLIQYTSGTTGNPKPVLVTAGAAAHNVRVARKAYDLNPNSVIVSWLPQYHDCGLMFLLLTVVSGATCVLTSASAFVTRPRIWLEMITEYKATCTPVPSFALPLVVRRGDTNKAGTCSLKLDSLKNLIIINEPLYGAPTEEFVKAFAPFGLSPGSISPSYGLAENCTFVSTAWRSGNGENLPIHDGLLPSAKMDEIEEEIKMVIVNEDTFDPVEDGVEGEIWISSPSNCDGYLGHPTLSRETFHARLKNYLTRSFVRTGDRGIIIATCERYLYVTGRCSDIIRAADGQEIHPHRIETSAYDSCPGLLRAGCVAAFESLGCVTVVAELRRPVAEKIILAGICERIKDSLAGIEVGTVVVVQSGSIPKTTSGKIRRWAAKIKLERGEMNVVFRTEFRNGTFLATLKSSSRYSSPSDLLSSL
ncbi:uncharacterized protein LOC127257230 [Andrographis paniculata]|uniref:uncharacterized protein LOC127257230 n=1 Tax=Andrographis paniculata TaxID=175694 RepID=UPI0021E7CD56|nr:uncharacterized protein LOC127257230 [Andrographis paniculata]